MRERRHNALPRALCPDGREPWRRLIEAAARGQELLASPDRRLVLHAELQKALRLLFRPFFLVRVAHLIFWAAEAILLHCGFDLQLQYFGHKRSERQVSSEEEGS